MASKDILVCGTLNLETTFPIAGFPLAYEPVCHRPFEFRSQPSGVGFNIAQALSTLGNRVRLASMIGSDFLGTALRQSMAGFGVSDEFILPVLDETPQNYFAAGSPDHILLTASVTSTENCSVTVLVAPIASLRTRSAVSVVFAVILGVWQNVNNSFVRFNRSRKSPAFHRGLEPHVVLARCALQFHSSSESRHKLPLCGMAPEKQADSRRHVDDHCVIVAGTFLQTSLPY